jgi:cytoskeletal protein RodZ
MRFCGSCGAEWVEPVSQSSDAVLTTAAASQAGTAPPAATKRPFFSGVRLYISIGVGILVGLMVLGAIVGEEQETLDSTSSTSSRAASLPTQQAPTEVPRSTAQPATVSPRATTAPAAAARPLDLKTITPVAQNLPPIRGEVLGTANSLAAEQVRQAMGTVI